MDNALYSHRDFTCQSLADVPAGDLAGRIVGSCFSQEWPDSQVFPASLPGTEFVRCNLDNCQIPAGAVLTECSVRRFSAQNDGRDWELDHNDKPLRPLQSVPGLSDDPRDLPADYVIEETLPLSDYQALYG